MVVVVVVAVGTFAVEQLAVFQVLVVFELLVVFQLRPSVFQQLAVFELVVFELQPAVFQLVVFQQPPVFGQTLAVFEKERVSSAKDVPELFRHPRRRTC